MYHSLEDLRTLGPRRIQWELSSRPDVPESSEEDSALRLWQALKREQRGFRNGARKETNKYTKTGPNPEESQLLSFATRSDQSNYSLSEDDDEDDNDEGEDGMLAMQRVIAKNAVAGSGDLAVGNSGPSRNAVVPEVNVKTASKGEQRPFRHQAVEWVSRVYKPTDMQIDIDRVKQDEVNSSQKSVAAEDDDLMVVLRNMLASEPMDNRSFTAAYPPGIDRTDSSQAGEAGSDEYHITKYIDGEVVNQETTTVQRQPTSTPRKDTDVTRLEASTPSDSDTADVVAESMPKNRKGRKRVKVRPSHTSDASDDSRTEQETAAPVSSDATNVSQSTRTNSRRRTERKEKDKSADVSPTADLSDDARGSSRQGTSDDDDPWGIFS